MAHDQQPKAIAEAEQDEALLLFRMIGISDQEGVIIAKHGLRLLEGDTVLPAIGRILASIPLEPQPGHAYIVPT
jgi:hypothetical protein